MDSQFAQRRAFIAPLFNSTGIATKIVNAMGRGIPVTTTPDGLRGLGFAPPATANSSAGARGGLGRGGLCVATDASAFAQCLGSHLTDDDAWARASAAGIEHIGRVLSPMAQRRAMRRVLSHPPGLAAG